MIKAKRILGMRKPASLVLLAATGLSLVPVSAAAKPKDWQRVSDIGAAVLVIGSLGLPVAKKDTNGLIQAAGSLALTSLVTEGLKQAFPKTRPDGSDRKSFPSGHTSRAFTSAATIYRRYGPAYGVPAFAMASLVGVARVKGKKHFWVDVLAGAVIGTSAGFLVTRKRGNDQRAVLIPWGDTKSAGLTFAMRF
jgi:membrane-associated phospholipid phosphatase